MKNTNQQRMIRAAQQYARKSRRSNNRRRLDPETGVIVYHVYHDEDGKLYHTRANWDDCAFYLGSQKVVVLFTHPRYEFAERMSAQAFDEAEQRFPSSEAKSWINGAVPEYQKVGRSRKKVRYYRMPSISNREKYDWIDEREKELCASTDVVQRATFKVLQTDYCRQVHICAPFEVIDEPSLFEMAEFTKQVLLRKASFDERFGDYQYTNKDWLSEQTV